MFNWQYPVYRFINRCRNSVFLATLLTSLFIISTSDVLAGGCDNVTHPGSIGYDQSVCPGTSPATIQSLALPSGGNGTIEYIWLETTIDPPSVSNSTVIAGANGPSYTPGQVSQTTYFRRCARRSGCSTYVGETNWVTVSINQCCSPLTVSSSVTDALCSGGVVSTSCPCSGKMTNLSVRFNGSSGSTVKVYTKSDKSILINTYSNVSAGDILFVDASGLSNGEFESSTYFEVVGTSGLTSIHTSCSDQIDGLTFGDFTVVGYTDGSGNVCNSLVCSGSIDVTVTSGTPPYLYCWSNGSNSEDISGICPGTYSLTVSDQNGCSSVHSFTVGEQPSPISITGNVTDASCMGIINPMNCPCSGKMTNLSLMFDGVNGSTVKAYTKSDMNTLISTYTNVDNGDILFVDASGLSNGEFESSTYFEVVGASGLTSIHTSCSQQIDGMSFGDFTVVGYTDGSGNVCNVLSCSGSIDITVSGATDSTSSKSTVMISKRVSDYKDDAEEYKKDGSMLVDGDHLDLGYQSTHDQIVGVRFRDLNIPQGAVITNAYIEFVAKFSKSISTNLTFNGEDTDDASGFSTSDYDISNRILTTSSVNWNNVPAWTQGVNYVSPDLSAIVQEIVNRGGWSSGNDLAIIVDGNGQRPAESYDFDHNDAPLLVVEYSITSPAVSSISYQWSNGATTEDLSNVCAGTYSVTVTDALGCIAEQTFVVTEQPSTLSLSATKVDADCGGVINTPSNCPCNGKMTSLTVKYLGVNGVDIEVCEDKDCNDIITTYNNVQTGDFLAVSASGLSGGEFSSSTYFRVVGSTSETSIHTSCSQAIGGMTFGDYTVAGYTDGSGNVCNSIVCNGSIDLTTSGGNSPYSYSWSNGQTTEDLSSVCPGTYTVTVTDAGGCSEVLSVDVDEAPPSLIANVNSINANCGPVVYDPIETCECNGKMTELVILYNGTSSTVNVKDGGGSTILTYNNVSNGDTLVVSASAAGLTEFDSKTFLNDGGGDVEIHTSCSQDIQGGTFGNFKVIGYTDGAGNVCNEDQPPCDCNGEITEVTLLFNGTNGSTVEVYENTGDPALLTLSNVDNNQIIVITPSSLGISGFGSKIFVGSNGGTAYEVHTSCSQDISGLVVGDLTVVGYIDGSGSECSGVECAGSASSSPSGGTPPYSFQWSTGDMTSSVSGLCPGVYFLTVTDSIGCAIVQCVEIGESPDYVINVNSTNPSCAVGACDGSITLSVTGGLSPLTYTWNGPGLTNANLGNADSNLCSGTYTIVISDANGCSDSVTVTLTNPPPIVLIPNSTDVNCAGNSDGTATVSASGGTGTYSYLWSNSATTQSIVGLSAGTYSVTVTDANGCTAVTSVLIEEPLPLTAAASAVDAQCFATCDGSVTVVVNGGNGGLTYLWNDANNQTTHTATGLCAGTYTVTVTDDHGCTATASATVQEPTQIVISINTTNTTCSDSGATGSAIANASGGTPGYSWLWDNNANNQTTKTATGLSAGNYLVTVTDANGCMEIASAKILEDAPLVLNTSSTPASCFGDSDGSASVSVKNGNAPFSYSWSNGASGSIATGLSAGTYSVTVTDVDGCSASASATVTQPDTLVALATCVPVSCFGANDGSASSIVTGGTPPYVLTWYSTIMHVDTIPPDTFPMANNLKPQMFYGFVVDANGCTDSLECEITEPDSLTTFISNTNVSCNGFCDGSATAQPSGGTPPYSYFWSDGSSSASNSGLCPGIYYVTVIDANGCTSTGNVIILEPTPILLSSNKTNVTCNGFCDGTAAISASGGIPPYSYAWSNGGITASLNGLCAGTYTVTVTDANGCTEAASVMVMEPDPLLTNPSQTNVSCFGFCDGSATINAFGGTPPYSYIWSIGATTTSITGLCPGNYSVTVTDANGCTEVEIIFITEPDSLDLATSSTNVSCNGECDGTSSVTASGGTSPYSYLWSNGANTASVTGLCAGSYTVTVTDANQCSATANVIITEPTLINLITNTTNAGCLGNNTGTASVSASGGVPGYAYSWSNGGNTQTITGLAPGLYTVIVTDANQCTAIDTAIVQEQTNTLSLNANATDADCGGITIDPSQCPCSGGMTNLTVKYIGASGVDVNVCEDMSCNDIITSFTNVQNGQFLYVDASGLSGGDFGSKTYFSVVGSGNSTEIHTSCSQDIGGLTFGDYTVAGFTDGSGNVCNAIICNGSIDLMVSGGTAPFTYSWSNGQSTEDISTLCAGVYDVTVMDDAGCTATLSVTVEELPPAIDANITTTNADCGPLVFDPIETCECSGKMTELVILYNGTSSTVDVKDGGGTTILTFNNVNNGDTLVVSASAAGLSEFDSKTFFNDGGGDVEIHTSCSQDIQGGTYGNFKVIGYTDGSGNVCNEDRPPCECDGEITEVSLLFTGTSGSSVEFYDKLGDPALLTLSNVNNGQLITVTPSSLGLSGFGSKMFVGSNGGTAHEVHTSCSQDISGLVVGDLTVVGYIDGSGNECNSVECEGTASAAPSGGTPPYTYQWSTGETSSSVSGLCPGSYCVTITDSLGCSITECFDINQDCGSIGDYVWCDDNGDGIQDSNEAPIAGVIIQLLDASGNVIATDTTDSNGLYLFDSLSAGTYTVNVVDSSVPNGKVLTTNNDPTTVNLGQGENRLDVDFGYNCVDPVLTAISTDVSCHGGNDGSIDLTVNNGSGPSYTYLWSTGATTEDISGLIAGTYSVTVSGTSLGDCSDTLTITIDEPTPLSAIANSTKESCAGANNGTATVSAFGGTPPYTYLWSNGGNSATITGLAPGSYSVIVTDQNGCTATDTTEVVAAIVIDLAVNTTDVSCFGESDGEALVNALGGKGPYTYMWDANAGNQTTKTATGLAPGTYEVTVTDANGCVDSIIAKILEPAKIVLSTNTDTVFCTDDATGAVTVSVDSGGIAPYTYQWDSAAGSQTTATATGLSAGSYGVTVTDDNGCTASATANVVLANNLVVDVTCSPVSCNGDSDGSASSSVSGGTLPYTYLWSNGGNGPSISGLTAGTYTLTLTDANGCVVIRNCTVTEPDSLVVTATCTPVTCFGSKDGTATSNITGGTQPYIFTWFSSVMHIDTIPPDSLPSATGLAPGLFTGYVVDANGCTDTLVPCEITEPEPLVGQPASTDASCFGGSDGTANVLVSGGNGGYTYQWSTGATTQSISGLSAGVYSVTTTDSKNCICIDSVVVGQPDSLNLIATCTPVTCFGSKDGTVSSTVFGGTAPYIITYFSSQTYVDTVPPSPFPSASGRGPEEFSGFVVDANGCIDSTSCVITEPDPLVGLVSSTDVSCFGNSDGTASVSAVGGNGGYSYNWSTGDTTAMISGLSAGVYVVTSTDSKGCICVDSAVISQPDSLIAIATCTPVTCFGSKDGTASANVSGGTAPYIITYFSSQMHVDTIPPDPLPSGSNLGPGFFYGYVVDANGCIDSLSCTITEPSPLIGSVSSTPASCNGGMDGTASATATGGNGNYSFNWSNGASTSMISGLAAGTYSVTISDVNGCICVDSVVVSQPPALQITLLVNDVSCFGGNNGSVTATVTGGTPPPSYLWSTGDNSPGISGVTAGTYGLTVTDANGCTTAMSATVNQPDSLIALASCTPVSCFGAKDGSAAAVITGGTQPYIFTWFSTIMHIDTIPPDTFPMESGLGPQSFYGYVVDANGCTDSLACEVTEPDEIILSTTTTPVSCFGGNNGAATVSASGGVPPYSYQWDANAGNQTTQTATGLSAGTYSVTVTDATNCTATTTATVSQPTLLTITFSTTPVTCNGGSDGTATAVFGGGTPPYSCVWSSGDSTITAFNLSAGTYTVVCTDANGCTTSGSVTVTEPTQLTTTTTSTMPSCNGGNDGTATTNPSGGTPPYSYLWDANAGSQTSMTATGLSAGTYNVAITDGNGCTTTDNVAVNQPTPVSGTIARTPVTCNGGSDGTATVTIGGGTPPYTCVWSTGDTTSMLTGLSAGTYSVTCTDANGCFISTSINILEPTAIVLTETHTDVSCNGGNDGSGTVMASGGTPGYTYAWPTSGSASTETGLSAGTYTVTVTDANGCTATINVVISEPPLLVTQITVTNSTCFDFDDASFTVSTSGGTPPYTITWTGTVDSGGTFPAGAVYTVSGLAPQDISGYVTDAMGCVDSFNATITEPDLLTSFNMVTNVSVNGGVDGSIDLMVMGGTQPYSYNWSNGAMTEDLDSIAAGFYSVTVTDANGCIHTVDSIEVLEPSIHCETATEVPHVLTINTGFFASEIGWALLNNTTGDTLSNSNCSDLNNANITINDTVCFEPTEEYCFFAYDDWGDGWNGGNYLISNLETNDTVASGMPDNGITGDETAGCTGSDLEADTCFYLDGPPVFGCMDMNATNYNPSATVDDGSCLYNITFAVDMTCMDPPTSFSNVYVTGPLVGWCGNCLPLVDQGGGIWSNTFQFPAGTFEYKYIVDNFTSQENLIDDMQGGATCAPVTDYFSYANRTVEVGTVASVSETYGSCSPCPTGGTPGCTDANAVNYNPSATTNDGSCQYNVTFNVDMSCSGETFSTVSVTGPFCGWCNTGFELTDPDTNGIYTGTFVMSSPVEYKYMVDGFASQENLVDDMVGGATCAPVTDYFNYANRLETFSSDITLNNTYGSCSPCPSAVSGCTDPAALNYNPSATVEDGSCTYPIANDDCASAISVSCGSSVSGTTIGSTASDAPGKCNVLLSDPGVWYEFTGTGENITVSACNANFDVRLGVFEGSCLALTCVAGDDNSCGGTGAEATFSSSVGSKYYIYISGVGTGTFVLDVSCSALAVCPSPENLVELNMTSTKVTLSWDPVPGAIGYAIKGNASIATTPDVEIYPYYNGTSLTVSSGLVAGLQYYWQVAAICDVSGDTSAYSPRSNFVLPTCPAPTPVTTTNVTATTATLNWTPQPNAVRYVISGRIVPSSNIVTLNINNPATSSLNVSQLLSSSTYQWTIQSVCVGAASSIAPVQSFTTLAQTSKLATENGIENKPTLGVHVFPNPNNGNFQLDLTNMLEEQAEIVIYDVVGKEVFRSRVSPNSADMSTSNIELRGAGTYLIKVVSENGTTISERVIVQ